MRSVILAVALCGSICSCTIREKDATAATASELEQAIVTEIKSHVELDNWSSGRGRAGNIVSRHTSFIISDSDFDISRIHAIAQQGLQKWGQFESYSTRGRGGAEKTFSVHFGSHRTHLFCRVIAHHDTELKKNVLEIFIDLLE